MSRKPVWYGVARSGAACVMIICALFCQGASANGSVEIRRTADGMPHVLAHDWRGLGYGYGYAQASDNLCTMAESFVTYRGERSRYFGADQTVRARSTLGQPHNLDADFFFKMLDAGDVVTAYREHQPATLRALVDGFADGYNAYLRETPADQAQLNASCRGEPWLMPISADDVYRRLYAANLAGGEARFVKQIVSAAPPVMTKTASVGSSAHSNANDLSSTDQLAARDLHVGGRADIGSNALAFGGDATVDGASLLLGNPHWYWRGPDRFYQAQLTIPGKINVSGVSLLGTPVIMIGFNDNVAWTHTVSAARRFGIFELSLDPSSPTHYLIDGRSVPMTPVPLAVTVRHADGSLNTVHRVLYRTQYGPVVDLSAFSPALKWDRQQAYALRDINADNYRVFENFLDWNRARSLNAFIDTQKRLSAVPWVNTIAIGRGDARVWFGDIGAVPNVSQALAQRCTTMRGKSFEKSQPGVPFLDGSRSDCDWTVDAQAAQPGALRADQMPSLLRRDFVANMNNSYWLTNPRAPLSGYAPVAGAAPERPSLRAQLGIEIASGLAEAAKASDETVQHAALAAQSMSAMRFKNAVLDRACSVGDGGGSEGVASKAAEREVIAASSVANAAGDMTAEMLGACEVLKQWNNTAAADAPGAPLWNALWSELLRLPPEQLYAKGFDPAQPLTTPAGIRSSAAALRDALQTAIRALHRRGLAVDARIGESMAVGSGALRIPLYGGCSQQGYFTAACPYDAPASASGMDTSANLIDPSLMIGNTYLQTVRFTADGVEARTLMAGGESDDPASPHALDGARRYARQDWLKVPFTPAQIAVDPALTILRLAP